jgi:hypothetical protein
MHSSVNFAPDFWNPLMAYVDRDTLRSLALTCEHLRDHAQRALFGELVFTGWRFEAQITKRQRPMLKLIRTRILALSDKSCRVRPYAHKVVLKDWTQGHPHGAFPA